MDERSAERCLSNFVLPAFVEMGGYGDANPETALDSLSFDKWSGCQAFGHKDGAVDASKQFAHKFDCVGNFKD